MRTVFLTILLTLFTLAGCKKDNVPQFSGTVTIDNKLYGTGPYYAIGFSFPEGKKVSTSGSPVDVFTINVSGINSEISYFDAQNYNNSFFRYGAYGDAEAASLAFSNLTTFTAPLWKVTGDSVKINQIWLFRTSIETYAKFRIISTISEVRDTRDYAECTFEWVYQPDGSLTFPAK